MNTAGSFTCACPAGFIGTGIGASGCGPRFTDLGGGVVRDNANSAEWQQAVPSGRYAQPDAIAYCSGLMLNGGGWRLPTLDELLSIVDTRFAPAVDPAFFPGTPGYFFWSSSAVPGWPSRASTVAMSTGSPGWDDLATLDNVRCVR